jgi:hypothetical protein
MPVKPSYCRNLPEAIEILRSHKPEWVGRKDVEDALGVSKTVAWRLLRHCGATVGPGNTLLCRRLDLIARFEELIANDGKIYFEVQRRQRLTAYLNRIRPEVIANRTKVVPDENALGLISSRFTSLPPAVTLTPASLHIEFSSPAEFLAAVGSVIYALNNDYEAVAAFIEDGRKSSHYRLTQEVEAAGLTDVAADLAAL